MKILIFTILAIIFVTGTMTFASAQTGNFSVGLVSSFGGAVGTNTTFHFITPQGIAVDDSGNIYVTDRDNAQVDKFDSKGNFLLKIGSSSSSANGYLLGPEAVAVDKSGNIYVAESNNNRIDKFDPAGNFMFRFGTQGNGDGQFSDPWGVAVDDSGNIYVADLYHPIQKFDSSGNFISTIGKGMIDNAQGIALDKSGNIYALDNGNPQVVEFSSTGAFVKEWGSYCNIVTKSGCVDPDGSGPFEMGDGQFKNANGITIDDSGNVYVADMENNRVEIFDPAGHFFYKFGSFGSGSIQFASPVGIAVDKSGDLSVVNSEDNKKVQIFSITYGNATSAPNEVSTSPTMYPSTPQDTPSVPQVTQPTTTTPTQPTTPSTTPTQTTMPQVTQPSTPSTTQVAPQVTQPTTPSTIPHMMPQIVQPTTVTSVPALSSMPSTIPVWVKGIFNYYGQGQISDNELISAINFLVQQGIVKFK